VLLVNLPTQTAWKLAWNEDPLPTTETNAGLVETAANAEVPAKETATTTAAAVVAIERRITSPYEGCRVNFSHNTLTISGKGVWQGAAE